jgi:protein arginine N-methyltransferase 1
MLSDAVRMDAYVEALRRAVRSDSVVLDLGAGTGIFAILARQFGARKVYAVETNSALELGRTIARENHLDQIEFIQALSTAVYLPEPATIIISDLRGVLPLCESHLHSIIDARQRLLAPGGVLIPRSDTVWVAVAEAPQLYRLQTDLPELGVDLSAARRIAVNSWRRGRVSAEQLLVEPRMLVHLDYPTIKQTDVTGHVEWDVKQDGEAHGLSVWFNAEVAEGLTFSTSSLAPETIYGTAFFPLERPVLVRAGDSFSATISADLVGNDYVWRWETRVIGCGPSREVKAHFKQSTFYGGTVTQASLRKRADSFVPVITEEGEIDRFILSLIDGKTAQGHIAKQVTEHFPERFSRWQDTLTRIGELTQKYSE